MGYHDALGSRGRTRGEDQLCRILRENLRGGRRRGCMQIYLAQTPAGSVQSACGRRDITANQHQPRVNHLLRVAHHLGGGAVVDRNDDASVEQAAPECGDPFRTRLGPDDNFIAFADGLAPQPLSEGAAGACDLVVAIAPAPVSVVVNDVLGVNVGEFVNRSSSVRLTALDEGLAGSSATRIAGRGRAASSDIVVNPDQGKGAMVPNATLAGPDHFFFCAGLAFALALRGTALDFDGAAALRAFPRALRATGRPFFLPLASSSRVLPERFDFSCPRTIS